MRTAPLTSLSGFTLLLALLTGGCATHQFVNGAVSYTSTPPVADHSGALPLTGTVCVDHNVHFPSYTAGVQLGSCKLAGRDNPARGRGASGGSATLHDNTGDGCVLPTSTGDLPIRVDNATLQYGGTAVDVTVGGTTNDGRYLTYRFTGTYGAEAPSNECDEVLKPIPAAPASPAED